MLSALGRPREPLDRYMTYRIIFESTLPFRGPALFRLGETYEALGRARARESYQRFLSLWAGSVSRFEPMLRKARERVGALGSEE